MCGLVIETADGRVTSIRGDADDVLSRGHICPKAVALQDLQDDPDRLRFPVRREGTSWTRVPWNDALDEVAARLRAVQARHGRDAVAAYVGNPTVHSLGAMRYTPPFLRALGTRNRFSASSVDQLPHHLAATLMFGHPLLLPIPDIDRTQHLLVFGANPVASNGSLMTAPGIERRLVALRARGGRLVVVDPRRTETAALADAHHAILPGTDALVLAAMIATLFADGRISPGHVGAFTRGLDTLRDAVAPFTPDRVAGHAGLSAACIRTLARDFAAADRAVAYGRMGVSTQAFGSVSCWLVTALNLVTGRLDAEGGAMFTAPAIDPVGPRRGRTARAPGRWRSRVRGLPETNGELPSAALAEEIDTPGPGQVRALVTSAGNPVLSTPNGTRLERALPSLEFMASIDFYVNETTRHAHIILPPTAPLEREHYDAIFHVLAVRNTAKYSPPLFAPPGGALHDWQILNGLAWRLARGRLARARGRIVAALHERVGLARQLDAGLRTGPYGAGWRPWTGGLTLRRLRDAPGGIDLGPLQRRLPGRLHTPDGQIDVGPALLVGDLERLAGVLASGPPADDTLSLIGRRDVRSNNSWMHNTGRLMRGAARCTLLMHPDDAGARGLATGALARVTSRVGEIVVPVEVTGAMRVGVVSLPHGWGHGRPGVLLRVAGTRPGASINDLTDDLAVDAPSGNAAFSGVRVGVAAVVSPSTSAG
jgi:anaerobic selenocysteine-containing dehydrogenase